MQTENVIDILSTPEKHKEKTPAKRPPSQEKWTRATFIVRADLLDKLKYYAYLQKRQLKDVLNEGLDEYFKSRKVKSPRE
jgi:hypothetical protein